MRGPVLRFLRASALPFAFGAAMLWTSPVRADWCETFPGSQVFTSENCNKQDYEVRQGARKGDAKRPSGPGASDRSLRDRLRDALRQKEAQSGQADQIAERITKARERAEEALRRGKDAADDASRAKAQRDYTRAMQDLGKAYADADAFVAPGNRPEWQSLKQQSIAALEAEAADAFAPVGMTQSAAAPSVNATTFEICEPESAGQRVRTCYQVPRRGLSCVKVHKNSSGDVVWRDPQERCERADVLEARNAYFNRLEATRPQSPSADTGPAQLPDRCRVHLKALLDGAQAKNGGKAEAAYAALRAQCDAHIRKLAEAANARLPERKLNSRARGALAEAMNRQPGDAGLGRGSGSSGRGPAQVAAAGPDYDVNEVIDLGIGILDLLNGAAALQSARTVPQAPLPAVRPPTQAYGQGAPPPYQAPRNRPSDITGTR